MCATRHAQSTQNESLHIFAISPEKRGWEVDFLPANKHKNFLQVDSIALGLRSQACAKYPKQVYNIAVISSGKREGLDLLPTDKRQRFLQIAIFILGVLGQTCPNYPK